MSTACKAVQETIENIQRDVPLANFWDTVVGLSKGISMWFEKPLEHIKWVALRLDDTFGFREGGRRLLGAAMNVVRHDNASRMHYNRFASVLNNMRRLGFFNDGGDAWKHGFVLLHYVHADALIDTPVALWNAETIELVHGRMLQRDLKYADKVTPKFDKRSLDAKEFLAQRHRIDAALKALTPLQKEALQDLARELRSARRVAVDSAHLWLNIAERYKAYYAGKTGGAIPELSQEERQKAITKMIGPTVTSYITLFVKRALGEEMDEVIRASAGGMLDPTGALEDFGNAVHGALAAMPSDKTLRALGLTKAKWLALELGERLFGPGAGEAAYFDLHDVAREVLAFHRSTKIAYPEPQKLIAMMTPQTFNRFYRRRVSQLLDLDKLENPFRRMELYIMPTLRKSYLDPAMLELQIARLTAAKGQPLRLAGSWGAEADAKIQAWVDSVQGGRPSIGTEIVQSVLDPMRSRALTRVGRAITNMIYTKILWLNTSMAALNLTQPLQYGISKWDAHTFPLAFKMLLSPEYAHVQTAMAHSALSESSLGAVFGAAGGGSFLDEVANLGDLIRRMRLATSPKEAARIATGELTEGAYVLGSFMALTELGVRRFTAANGIIAGALDQLERQGAKIIKRGMFGEIQAVFEDGTVVHVLDEIKKAAPHIEGMPSVFLADGFGKGESAFLDWRALVDYATQANVDTNFVLSNINYSPFERYIRKLPLVGHAAAVFTNYTMHVASKLVNAHLRVAAAVARDTLGIETAVSRREVAEAWRVLRRYYIGTLLVGGPFAFHATMTFAHKLAAAADPDVPEDIAALKVDEVARQLEKFSVAGMPQLFGLPGLDWSRRVGFEVPWSFLTGGRFLDSPLMEQLNAMWTATPWSRADMYDKEKARYDVLGVFAKFFDPTGPYRTDAWTLGKLNPIWPVMLHNLAQMFSDLHDAINGQPLRDGLNNAVDFPQPVKEVVTRGLFGRTIYQREVMDDLARKRPALSSQISDLRRRYVDAWAQKDYAAMRAINEDMHRLVPLEGHTDNLFHPYLDIDNQMLTQWKLRHTSPTEIRQLIRMHKGVAQMDYRRSLRWLEDHGYANNHSVNAAAVEQSDDVEAKRHLQLLHTALHRSLGQ